VALEKYVQPALLAGRIQFSVAVRDLMNHLQARGFPQRNWPQVCTAIQTQKFLRENGLEIERVDGPAKKLSSTVVVRYQVAGRGARPIAGGAELGEPVAIPADETASERAFRLCEKLRGLLKEELAEYGGGEAFLRWIRSEEEDEDAA